MAFPARYPGNCSKCNQRIERGEMITWSRKERGKVYHATCSEDKTATEATTETTVTDSAQVETQAETQVEGATSAYKGVAQVESTGDAFAPLAKAIAPYLDNMLNAKLDPAQIESLVAKHSMSAAKVADLVTDLVAKQTPIAIEVKRSNGEVKRMDNVHTNFAKLTYLVSKGHHVYLYGGPGSGKSTAARQAAEALGVEYGYISLNPQTPDSRLLGFVDANGTYRETVFMRLYRDGGVFCIDEVDNASPSLLTTLNSALENGHASFPCGMVQRHSNFVVIATGNTCGRGANPMFPERRPFDAAFSERFTFIEWDYDTVLERNITLGINTAAGDWLGWVLTTRAICKARYPKVMVTPRASFKGAEYLLDNTLSVAEIAECLVFKGLDAGTKQAILNESPLPTVRQ